MQTAICHYSFHRTWKEEQWDCVTLADAIKATGAAGIDFHAGLLGDHVKAGERISQALDRTGLTLSGLSMSNNFNQEDPEQLKSQIDGVIQWIHVAAKVGAPVSRIFGGHISDRGDGEILKAGFDRILTGLRAVVREAEKCGVVLALENHGGLPCSGEEQVEVIESINSANLKATVDVGNYMQCGQEGLSGTAIAAHLAAYVHFKDNKKNADAQGAKDKAFEACTVGRGDVDLEGCLGALRQAGYDGFIALEYEGQDDERRGVADSIACMHKLIG